jgi:hypothetical protein
LLSPRHSSARRGERRALSYGVSRIDSSSIPSRLSYQVRHRRSSASRRFLAPHMRDPARQPVRRQGLFHHSTISAVGSSALGHSVQSLRRPCPLCPLLLRRRTTADGALELIGQGAGVLAPLACSPTVSLGNPHACGSPQPRDGRRSRARGAGFSRSRCVAFAAGAACESPGAPHAMMRGPGYHVSCSR